VRRGRTRAAVILACPGLDRTRRGFETFARECFEALRDLDPAETLVIVSSKTFTTQETLTNTRPARAWIIAGLGEATVEHHFAAVSTKLDLVQKFGIKPDRVFGFWDWVDGRYSIWSSIGLELTIAIGQKLFEEFLRGGYGIDTHFREAPLERNIPALMGLIGIVIASIVNIFIESSALQFAISIIGVIVFVGLTAYDTQRIKEMYLESDTDEIAGKKAVLGALAAGDPRYGLLFKLDSQALPEHVEVVLNDRVLDLQGGLAALLKPGDVLRFLPAHAGG